MRAGADLVSEEQLMLRDSVRRFVREQVPEEYAEVRPGEDRPAGHFRQISEMGWLVSIPEEYGGAGLGFTELGIVLEELSYGLLGSVLVYRATVHGARSLHLRQRRAAPQISAFDRGGQVQVFHEPHRAQRRPDAAGIQTGRCGTGTITSSTARNLQLPGGPRHPPCW